MKNFTFLFKTLALTCLLTAWGGVEMKASEVYNFDCSTSGVTHSTMSGYSNNQTNTITYGGVTWNLTATSGGNYTSSGTEYSYYWNWNSNTTNGLQMGSNNLHHDDVTITSVGFAVDAETYYAGTNISKVVVTAHGASSTTAYLSVKVGNQTFTCDGSESVTIASSATAYEFEYANGATGEIEIYYSQPTTSAAMYFIGVEVYDADGKVSPELAYSATSVGADTDDYATVVLPTLTYVEDFDGLSEITYTSSNTDVATVDENGTVTLTGTIGSATITASFPGNDNYEAAEASYSIQVDAVHTFDFEVHDYGLPLHTDGNSNSYDTDDATLEGKDGVTIDISVPSGNGYRLWQGTSYNDFRAYAGVVLTFNAPSPMTEISLYCESGYVSSMTCDVGTYSTSGTTGTWTGEASTVTFTLTGQMRIRNIDVTLAEATSGTITISSVGYATYYTDAEYTMPTGLVGTTVTSVNAGTDDTDFTLTMPWEYTSGTTVPAGTALVLQGNEGTYTYAITSTGAAAVSENLLLGSETETTTTAPNGDDAAGYYFYRLANGSSGVGFYWGAENGAQYTSDANKAWLAILQTEAINVKFLSLGSEDDSTTGIQAVSTSHADSDAIYTLQGVRVNNMNQKGVYIVGSKKIIVK